MNPKYSSLYKQANFIRISVILDHFKVKYDRSFDYLISCPIPSHIHQSNTPSFKVYKNTNSFYCFGCKASGGPAHLTKHMLGAKTLEEALDYLASNFNLKTKSLAKSFFNISKSIKGSSISINPEILVNERFDKFVGLCGIAITYKEKPCFSYRKLSSFFDTFYYLKRHYVNNIIDRSDFDKQCDALFADLERFIFVLRECQEKDYAIDAESLLNQ